MKTQREKGTTKKGLNNPDNEVKEGLHSDDFFEKDGVNSGVSVFRKTTNPKVIIKSDKISNNCMYQTGNTCKVLGILCFTVMSLIILMTFFLSLKTYNAVNDIYHYINPTVIS